MVVQRNAELGARKAVLGVTKRLEKHAATHQLKKSEEKKHIRKHKHPQVV